MRNEAVVQLVADTFPGILAPFDASLGIIIRDKAAIVANRLHVNGKKVYVRTALRADFCF